MDRKEYTLWWRMADTALAAGIPLISMDTAAKLLAAVLQYGGGNEAFVFCDHLRADLHYISGRWGVRGGETPDPDLVEAIREYRKEMTGLPPEWLKSLFKERYGVQLNNYEAA